MATEWDGPPGRRQPIDLAGWDRTQIEEDLNYRAGDPCPSCRDGRVHWKHEVYCHPGMIGGLPAVFDPCLECLALGARRPRAVCHAGMHYGGPWEPSAHPRVWLERSWHDGRDMPIKLVLLTRRKAIHRLLAMQDPKGKCGRVLSQKETADRELPLPPGGFIPLVQPGGPGSKTYWFLRMHSMRAIPDVEFRRVMHPSGRMNDL